MEFIRSFRVGPFAIFDFASAYIVVYLLAPYLSKFFLLFGLRINRAQWLWLTLPIALFTHIVFSITTPLSTMFLSSTSGWLIKAVVLFMLYMTWASRDKSKN